MRILDRPGMQRVRQRLNGDIARLHVCAAADTRLSGDPFLQYNAATGAVGSNVRFRYNFAEGRELFIVYDTVLDTDRRDDPVLPLTERRTLVLKYAHALR